MNARINIKTGTECMLQCGHGPVIGNRGLKYAINPYHCVHSHINATILGKLKAHVFGLCPSIPFVINNTLDGKGTARDSIVLSSMDENGM